MTKCIAVRPQESSIVFQYVRTTMMRLTLAACASCGCSRAEPAAIPNPDLEQAEQPVRDAVNKARKAGDWL